MQVNLELYRVFATVAKAGSFTHASGVLNITQSAVSQSVKQLESQLKTQLFIRTVKGAVLTESGEILYQSVADLIDGVGAAERYFLQLEKLEGGSLNIGAGDTLSRYYLLEHLRAFHEKYPSIRINVTNRTSQDTLELLHSGRIDLGFVTLPVEGSDEFTVAELSEIHDCFICGEKYKYLTEKVQNSDILSSLPLMMLEKRSTSRRYVDAVFAAKNIHLRPQIELGSLDLLSDFARAGLGIACVMREFTDLTPDSQLYEIKLRTPLPPRKIAMLQNKLIPPSFALRAFMELLAQRSENN